MMDDAGLLAAYDAFRRGVEFPGMAREAARPDPATTLVRHRDEDGATTILYTQQAPAAKEYDVDRLVEAEIARVRRRGASLEWLVYAHDRPRALGERLLAHGFRAGEPETVLLLPLADARLPAPRQGAAVRLATSPAELRAAAAIRSEIWGGDAGAIARRLQERQQERPGMVAVYLALASGAPAATAQISYYPAHDFASLGSAATLPQHRRRGFYTALLYARLTDARRRAIRFVDAEGSPASRPLLERVGFRPLSTVTTYEWKPAPSPGP